MTSCKERMVDRPSSVAYVLDITDDETAVRYESRLAIDISGFVRKSASSFRVLGCTEEIVEYFELGNLSSQLVKGSLPI